MLFRFADLLAIILFFVAMTVMGIYFARKNTSTEEYFLGNRSFPSWAIGLSMQGTSISSVTFLAFPAAAFALDYRQVVQNLTLPVAAVLAVIFFIPFFRQCASASAFEYLEQRYGLAIRTYAAFSFVILNLVRLATVLYLISIPLAEMFGIPILWIILICGVVVGAYTVLGGIEAVIWTDVVQTIILLGGGVLCLVLIVCELPGGLPQIIEVGRECGKFSLGPMSWTLNERTFTVMILLGLVSFTTEYSSNQNVVQRYIAAKSLAAARRATWLCTVMSIPTWLLFFFIGTCLFAFAFPAVRADCDMRNQPTALLDGWKIEAETEKTEAIYRTGETAVIRIRLLKDGRPAPGHKLVYSFRSDNSPSGKGELISTVEPLQLKITPHAPGFSILKVDFYLPDGRKIYARAGFMTDPEAVRPGAPEPPDFDAFWENQKAAVRAEPLRAEERRIEGDPAGKFEVWDITVPTPGTRPVRAYLTKPAGEAARKYPALVTWHAAGVRSAIKQYHFAARGVLVLDVNAHGIDNGRPGAEYGKLYRTTMKNYRYENAGDRDNIYFNGMFRRLIRALDYLKSRPDWDGKTLIVYGASQGGAQALVAGGIDPDVTAVIAHEPALCDHGAPYVGRQAGWPRYIALKNRKPVDPAVAATVPYYDAAYFAAQISRARCLLITGFIDTTCVPSSVYAAYNLIPADAKRIVNFPQAIHGTYPEFNLVTDEFLDELLKQQP